MRSRRAAPRSYATARLLQLGKAPRALITGGTGHATVELYRAVERHPFWGRVLPPPRGRTEASVFRDMLLALGVAPEQLLPLEEDSTNCGGNAELSMRLAVEREGLKPQRIIMLQVGGGTGRNAAKDRAADTCVNTCCGQQLLFSR